MSFKNDAVLGTIFQLVFAGSFGTTWKASSKNWKVSFQNQKVTFTEVEKWKAAKNAGLYMHMFLTSSGAYRSSRALFSLGCSAVAEKVSANIVFKNAYHNC